MKLVVLYILAMPAVGASSSPAPRCCSNTALAGRLNDGPHGLTEMVYAYASATNNNGSAFAGLTVTSQWYQTTLGLRMLVGRFFLIIPTLAIAGSLVRKQKVPVTVGTFPTDTPLFGGLVLGVDPHRRRPDVLARPRARPHRRAPQPLGPRMSTTLTEPTATAPRPPKSRRRPSATRKLFDPAITRQAVKDSFVKLNPRTMVRNPVMFVVEVGSVLTTDPVLPRPRLVDGERERLRRPGGAVAVVHRAVRQLRRSHGRGPGQGAGGHAAQDPRRDRGQGPPARRHHRGEAVDRSSQLGDLCVVPTGELIPGDGDVVEGIATVDESAITGESAPVIRESGGDRSAVTGGTRVLSDEIIVRITSKPGETFLDRMIALVEGAERQKTPNEIALTILLAGLTIIFLLAVVTLQPFAIYSGAEQSIIVLVALLVCLIPTTIGALLSAIGIAGMDRLVQRNVLAMSGRAVEAAGDVNTLLLDKTGTITFGSRQAAEFVPVIGVDVRELAEVAMLSSLADETPEGRSIVEFAVQRVRPRRPGGARGGPGAVHRPDPHERHGLRRRPLRPQGRRRQVRQLVHGGGRHRARSSWRRSSTASPATAPRRSS